MGRLLRKLGRGAVLVHHCPDPAPRIRLTPFSRVLCSTRLEAFYGELEESAATPPNRLTMHVGQNLDFGFAYRRRTPGIG